MTVSEAAAAEVVKEDWGEVKKVADKVAKEATTIGMLWTQGLKDEEANQALKTYFEGLQTLLLLCHACTVGAGPTLIVTIRNAAHQVVNASLTLLTRAVSFSIKGAEKQEREAILPAHVGSVWEACNTLKMTPYTNRTAVGRSTAQVATSVKNVLQKIRQIKEGQSSQRNACDCGHADDEGRRRNEAYSHHAAHSHGHGDSGHDRCSDHDSGQLHSPDDSGHGHCELGHSHSGHKHCHHPLPHSLHNTLATHILNMRMAETMVILMSFLILMITVVMYAVDMELKKQALGMAMLVLKAWTPMKSFLKRRWQWLRQQDMWWSALLISSNSFYM